MSSLGNITVWAEGRNFKGLFIRSLKSNPIDR